MAEKERVWHDLKRREFDLSTGEGQDNSDDLRLGDLEARVRVLRKLSAGEYVTVYKIPDDESHTMDLSDTSYFQGRIEALRRAGLDIGKGDAEYGYRMPVPKGGAKERHLIVFRRK